MFKHPDDLDMIIRVFEYKTSGSSYSLNATCSITKG